MFLYIQGGISRDFREAFMFNSEVSVKNGFVEFAGNGFSGNGLSGNGIDPSIFGGNGFSGNGINGNGLSGNGIEMDFQSINLEDLLA